MDTFLILVNYIRTTYLGGFICFLIGIIFTLISLKNFNQDDTSPPTKLNGIFIGVSGIILGIGIIYNKIIGNW